VDNILVAVGTDTPVHQDTVQPGDTVVEQDTVLEEDIVPEEGSNLLVAVVVDRGMLVLGDKDRHHLQPSVADRWADHPVPQSCFVMFQNLYNKSSKGQRRQHKEHIPPSPPGPSTF